MDNPYTKDEIERIDYCTFEHDCKRCPWRDTCSAGPELSKDEYPIGGN